jgi:hypothetical protein
MTDSEEAVIPELKKLSQTLDPQRNLNRKELLKIG